MSAAGSVELYRREAGAGDPVLLLIGTDADHTGWARVAPRLAVGRRCISADNRDSGRSPRVPEGYSLDAMAADAVRVLDAAGVDAADVVGQSLGGAIAARLAALHPERVRRLVLVSTAARMSERSRAVLGGWPLLRTVLSPADYYRAVFPWLYSRAEYEAGAIEEAVAALAARPGRQEADAFHRHIDVVCSWDLREDLRAVRAPGLVITGADDLLTTPEDARAVAQLLGAPTVVIAGAGHAAVMTHAPAVVDAIAGFLTEAACATSPRELSY